MAGRSAKGSDVRRDVKAVVVSRYYQDVRRVEVCIH